MALQASVHKKVFQFNFKARTSRGLMRDKTSWFIKIWDEANPEIFGMGESGPLPGLSQDARPEFEDTLKSTVGKISSFTLATVPRDVRELVPQGFPAITFGLETALADLRLGGKRLIYDNEFVSGKKIPINGLIWMGDLDFMMNQINQKIAQGFRCIKLKVGGLDFDKECDVLQYIRKRYFREDIEVRLDANGAFKIDDVLFKLNELAKFNVHSIEQPLKPGHEATEELCRKSPIPVALDEELIGVEGEHRRKILENLKPRYIILKPTLHGGLTGCTEWIKLAESLGIDWWLTSALESSVGLNAISQFVSQFSTTMPQGLGTGTIYSDNIPSPLVVEKGTLFYDPKSSWDLSGISL